MERFLPLIRRFGCRLAVALGAFVAGGAAVFAAPAEEKVVLQLSYTHQFEFAGYYAAQFKGFFAAEGLEVEIRERTAKRQPNVELAEGRAHYGTGSATYLLDRLNGAPLVLVSTIYQHSMLALMVRADSDIRSPEELRGKRVATSGRHPEIVAMFVAEGVPADGFVRVEDRWNVHEILTGEAEAQTVFITDLPFDMKQQGIAVRLIRPQDYGVDFYGDSLFTSEQELQAHPERVAAMRRAVLRGWEYALEHPDEVIDYILKTYPNLPPKVTRERLKFEARYVARQINADLLDLGHVNPQRWRRTADIFVQLGMAANTARFEKFFAPVAMEGRGPVLPGWVPWSGAGVAALALLVLLANWRLQRLVGRRTQELEATQRREVSFFDLAPTPIMIQDVTAVAAHLEELRRAGVRDLLAHVRAEPGRLEEIFRLKRIVRVNRALLRTVGYPDVDEMNRSLRSVMTLQAMDRFEDELQSIWDGRTTQVMEKVYRTREGREVHMLINWSVDRVRGELDYSQVRWVFTDITGFKATQRALQESEDRYRNLFESTPNPMYIFEIESRRIVMVNESAVQCYGYSREEFLGLTVLDLRPADEVDRLTTSMQDFRDQIDKSGTHAAGIWRHRRKDGTILVVEVFTHSLVMNGRSCVLSLPFDVTAKLATERALRDSEARYRELFENAVGGVYRATPDGRFIAVNPAMARMYGFDSAVEMLAWNEREHAGITYAHEEEHRSFIEAIERHGKVENFESRIVDRHGNTLWISETSRAVRDDEGRMLYYEGFVTDITARRRLESEMLRASKLEAVGILAGGIAHDFNNILTVVLGNVTLAEMDAPEAGPVRRMLHDAKRATLRARDLTQQLLTFAKGGDPVRAAVALPELLREAAEFGMHGAKSRLELDFADDLWPANVDKAQIVQVVQNLVINSVQAMPDGGVVRIRAGNSSVLPDTLGHLAAGDYVKLTVADTGTGIAPELLTKIFDPYFTTKQQGSGLGLATVYSIVRKHQGHIEVESRLGRGTAFHLWLPAANHSEFEPKRKQAADDLPPARVLFMDDEEPIRVMAQLFFERLGCDVAMVKDGAAAVQAYREARQAGRPFDLVIMDLTVPGGMGGREALEKLREVDPQVRAIVSSGYSSDPVLGNFLHYGFRGVLPKPYSLEQLQTVMRVARAD